MTDLTITTRQRNLHVAAEAVAVLAVAPFMLWLASRRALPPAARVASAAIGAATLIVDGGLLLSYLARRDPA